MDIGFTGTRKGMTEQQLAHARSELGFDAGFREFHHGCCVGADEQAVTLAARWMHVEIVGHPSTLDGLTSQQAVGMSDKILHPLPPLERNQRIVDACDFLIACPDGPERARSGTWATVRYARLIGKAVTIIMPDGVVTHRAAPPSRA